MEKYLPLVVGGKTYGMCKEEEINFIETHDSYKKLQQNIAYTTMRLYIQYKTIDTIIIIMVIGR